MNLTFFIAKRYLISKKSTNAINLISLISLAGVTIGTAALIIVLSALNGMTGLVLSLYNSFDPDIKITPKQGKTFATEQKFRDLEKLPGVIHYNECLQENALIRHSDKQHIAVVKGVSPGFIEMTGLDQNLVDGDIRLDYDTVPFAVIGGGVATKLDVAIQPDLFPSMLTIYVPRKEKKTATSEEDAFHIGVAYPSGVFSLNDDFDYKYVLVPLEYARSLFGTGNEVSSIELGVSKEADLDDVKEEVRKLIGDGFLVRDRFEQNEILFKTLKSEKWWTFLILIFIIMIGTFNVIGCVTMLIIEKKKDLHILNAMGLSIPKLRKIFLTEGLLIVLSGAILGILLGLLMCWIQMEFALIPFSEGFVIDSYPVDVQWRDVLTTLGCVTVIGLLAGWIPVRRLTRLEGKI